MAKGGIDLRALSNANRNYVLKHIHEAKKISRTELAKVTGLSLSAVSRIIKQLLEEGYVIETGEGNSSGGRRPITICLNGEAGYIIGVDFGRSKVHAGVFDLCGELCFQYETAVHGKEYLEALYEAIDNCIASLKDPSKLLIIYCGVRGFIDNASGTILSSTTFGWSNIALRQLLMERYSVTVGMDINARLAALGEWKRLYDDINDMVYVTTSWGICAGVISKRELFRGGWGVAGEIGNTINFSEGSVQDEERCLNLEERCGGQMLIRRAMELWDQEENVLLKRLTGNVAGKVTVEDIISAAKASDPFAIRIVNEAAETLAKGLVNVVYTYNPSLIVIGGLLAEAGELLLNKVRAKMKELLPELLWRQLDVELSILRGRASLFGAAEAAFQYLFSSPIEKGRGRDNIASYGS